MEPAGGGGSDFIVSGSEADKQPLDLIGVRSEAVF